ncbi:MAG: HDIG domain-containing protein [Phycisphaerales bacterium]|nr:HDIG domain-containing protein [Phycisphaerales bacterium]
MGKDGSKPSTKPVNRPGTKSASRTNGKSTRRVVVQIRERTLKQRLSDWIADPKLFWGVLAFLGFVLVVGTVTMWALSQLQVEVGQIMRETRISRVEFNTQDQQLTQTQRTAARMNVPRVFSADITAFEELRADLSNLPRTLAGIENLDEVAREIRERFSLDQGLFGSIKAVGNDEQLSSQWNDNVLQLIRILRRRPLLTRSNWQIATQEGQNTQIELRYALPQTGDESDSTIPSVLISRDDAINIDKSDQLIAEISRIVRIAGFDDQSGELVEKRLLKTPRATFVFDSTATNTEMDKAAARVLPVRRTITIGQRLYSRGEVLDQASFELAREENARYHETKGSYARLLVRAIGVYGSIALLAMLLGGYIARYVPKILSKPARIGWMTLLVTSAIVIASIAGTLDPRMIWLATITPMVLIAVLISIAYDQRAGLAITGVATLIVMVAIGAHMGLLAIVLVGVASAIAQLGELRERRALIRMSIVIAVLLFVVTALDQLIELPSIGVERSEYITSLLSASAQAGISGLFVGGIALFTLPFIERAFDITTGMTLIELRDPKQPILKELQQRAPGTYNHSLNVASIAENAAESVGADALLTYVGCLYHDIGKMNKPGYFIENQSGGPNKHDKLTPAMSLLIIVGHVKDGMEMAREHGLPKALHHFIEAHHGTTLVEYFYRRAREQAAQADEERTAEQILQEQAEQLPDEVDYRYPGPKPQTKEVAIVMLADAIESATRSLSDPTPARIDALVRSLANKRLMDGQFDECDLTFRELSAICESISKSVASIYHGRIKYTSDQGREDDEPKAKEPTKSKDTGGSAKGTDKNKPEDPPARSA